MKQAPKPASGLLLIDKPRGKTSFSLVGILRKLLSVKTIGHAGTLDPMATGVMVMLVGKDYTRRSQEFMGHDKEYEAEITLGSTTDTYDAEGIVQTTSTIIPTLEELQTALNRFQGEVAQVPPMFSAKKVQGKKLYDLARKGIEIERRPCLVNLKTILLTYNYPIIRLLIQCSKGTYIRSIAHDLGQILNSGAYLSALKRTKSGQFYLQDCLPGHLVFNFPLDESRQYVLTHLRDCL